MKTTGAGGGTAALPQREARIDWTGGRLIGFAVAARDGDAFEVVQLHLNGQCVLSTVANRSVFDLAKDLAGLDLPSRENTAFELRIPATCLQGGLGGDGIVHVEIRTAAGDVFFDEFLSGLRDMLRLTEQPPMDLLFEVRFRELTGGCLYGTVTDRHHTGIRPALSAVLNQQAPEALAIYESSSDGTVHHFAVALRAERLEEGANLLRVVAADGRPLAAYPITLGISQASESERRIVALEAELAFLKHAVLSQNLDGLPARLSLLKSEIIGICSEMMSLQRVNFEREVFGARATEVPASAAPATVADPAAVAPATAPPSAAAAVAAAAGALGFGRKAGSR